jgi:uncharacterized protein involved in exopolysaccharide biosynthesis
LLPLTILIRGEHELAALRKQALQYQKGQSVKSGIEMPLLNIPKAGLQYLDGLREVKYRESLLELLTKQYEMARIDEGKDSAIVQVVDQAIRPETQMFNWTTRLCVAAMVMVVVLAGGVIGAFVKESLIRMKSDPGCSAQLEQLRLFVRSGEKRVEVAAAQAAGAQM